MNRGILMSTEDQPGAPRTRAEMRAAREAAEAAEAPAVPEVPRAPEEDRLRLPPVAQPVSSPSTPSPALNERQPKPPRQKGRSEDSKAAPDRRFLYTILAVVAVLVVVVGALGVVSLLQGPRVSQVQVDEAEAIQVSGSRVILTANQSLQEIDASQVTVEPEVPFTVDAAGRDIGIRFTVPLDDATKYTVKVADATGAGGDQHPI